MDLNKDLLRYINNRHYRRRLLLYRGGAELEFLKSWLNRDGSEEESETLQKAGPVEELILGCNRCGNIYNKKAGFGSGENGVFILLNRPGAGTSVENDAIKRESIDLLKKMIKAMGLDYNECYITNVIKCESRDAMSRPSLMFGNCENNLICELEEKQPRAVIVMGSILPLKKITADYKNISWYSIEHPVSLVKNPELKRPAWDVLKKAMSELK
ncbi:MAG: hypothetical protein MUC95_02140 [Spirochaetes bacterium]|nr:hypothetical protein [Spirochaetota bacterium]